MSDYVLPITKLFLLGLVIGMLLFQMKWPSIAPGSLGGVACIIGLYVGYELGRALS